MAPTSRKRPSRTEPTIWTTKRKWQGNLPPLVLWFVPTALGLGNMLLRAEVTPVGTGLVIAGTVVGWVATNYLGPTGNADLASQIKKLLTGKGALPDGESWFVGFATPRYSSALDPHEDLGYLVLDDDFLHFVSETRTLEIARKDITDIRFRPNVHTLIALGRWISIEGNVDGTPIRILIEPRTHPTLLACLRATKPLRDALVAWQTQKS